MTIVRNKLGEEDLNTSVEDLNTSVESKNMKLYNTLLNNLEKALNYLELLDLNELDLWVNLRRNDDLREKLSSLIWIDILKEKKKNSNGYNLNHKMNFIVWTIENKKNEIKKIIGILEKTNINNYMNSSKNKDITTTLFVAMINRYLVESIIWK